MTSTRAQAAFEITSWEETGYDEHPDGPKLSRATVTKTFRGEVEGTSVAELLLVQDEAGGAAYVALERVDGRVGDRSGTFIVTHGAVREDETPATHGRVVQGSGTGALRGLRGTAEYRHDEHGATFALDYGFD